MKSFLLVMTFMVGCGVSLGQRPTQVNDCYDSAQTQYELDVCASKRAKQAKADLKVVYAQLIKAASGDPTAQSKFRVLENSWLRFRTAYLNASFPATDKQANYGSMFPMEFDDLATEITREQIARLKQILKDYQDNKF